MTLDELLNRPLTPVQDGGFSARLVLKLRRAEEKRRLLLWGAGSLALLPLVALLPMTVAAQYAMAQMARAASLPYIAYGAGVAVLLWALRPTPTRFF